MRDDFRSLARVIILGGLALALLGFWPFDNSHQDVIRAPYLPQTTTTTSQSHPHRSEQ